jgi:hypothetical protein
VEVSAQTHSELKQGLKLLALPPFTLTIANA